MKNIDMIEFLLVDLKYEWYNYYANYLKNYTEEERMKIRDVLQVVRDDQWLNGYRLAISTNNKNELEYLCMFNYNLMDDGNLLEYAISWAFQRSMILSKKVYGYKLRNSRYYNRAFARDLGCIYKCTLGVDI